MDWYGHNIADAEAGMGLFGWLPIDPY